MLLHEIRELFTYHSKYTETHVKHDHFNVFIKILRDIKPFGFNDSPGKKILELGCGQRYSLSLQFAALGAEITALDVDYVKPDVLPVYVYQILKHNGPKRCLKSILRRVLFDKRYYKSLESYFGSPLSNLGSEINFVIADVTIPSYPLPSEAFDLIISNAVLEHVANVDLFAAEINRLLVKGGFFHSIIHNFYSISGGHSLEWAYPDENLTKKVLPWEHLRKNRFPSFSYLNRYKPEEYQQAFGKHFEIKLFEGRDINHDPRGTEGESFLKDEVASELAQYPKELLITRCWCLICQKS